jgi:hypothetical protein
MVALFEFLGSTSVGAGRVCVCYGLCGTINILLQAANNPEEIRSPDQLTYASGKYSIRKP